MRLIDNWKAEFHRLWSIRASLALGTFLGVASVTAAFVDVFNPWFLLGIAVFVNIAIIPLTRIVAQEKPPVVPLPDAPQ